MIPNLNLPENHIALFLNSHPHVKRECLEDISCQYLNQVDKKSCWGYEDDCRDEDVVKHHRCHEPAWGLSGREQEDFFWKTADFGYIKKKKNQLVSICQSNKKEGSSLNCSKHMRYCKARNIYINLKQVDFVNSNNRFKEDVFKPGDLGGDCTVNQTLIKSMGSQKGALSSWFSELKDFTQLNFNAMESKDRCDASIREPTFFMKLDAGINMYHHFCDFLNLYASQHINSSFGTDVQIIIWDTSDMYYMDIFESTWKAFSNKPLLYLNDFAGKTLCIEDALFPLLPRMMYGLYYNMPLIPGCHGTSLFRAFSEHILHRLNIRRDTKDRKIRITMISRQTKHRRVLNEVQLITALNNQPGVVATLVGYSREMSFTDQLKITHNTDILIGMHGAGLTHLLFLPNWAAVFELYNCEDEDCYYDLARLRGVRYFTWTDVAKLHQDGIGQHPTISDHKKFANYTFDVTEFLRIVNQAVGYVRNHPEYIEATKNNYKINNTHGARDEKLKVDL
ncbi:hypothetical protein HELRODRAFT_72578 [Helobdella robusta]|uniref:EGF domain-specific O-linked N-acetylglucosamine transferase n=1 Tax=Helobdella robusta TaxID=6412 RepID=T1G121_HELRO|nr:hypothetical protein HELRODRAFT_72578 [Helobdella robusta]ESO10733.1 hypothetical protein HELRODRAFT_72578 [Helobdella robusta]